MTIYSMPSAPRFKRDTFGLVANTQEHASPLSAVVQTRELPGARWQATYVLPPMPPALAAPWRAFLVGLRGRAGRFYGYDPDARIPRGTARAALIDGAGQSGTTLKLKGLGVGQTLLAGDYLAYDTGRGRTLHIVVADATADSSGRMAVLVEPPIRTPPPNDAAAILTEASCVMMLSDDAVGWDGDESSFSLITFSAIEALT